MALGIQDNNVAGGLRVDSTPSAARAILYGPDGNPITLEEHESPALPTGILGFGMNDRQAVPQRADRLGSIGVALHTPLFQDSFEGTTVHPLRWLVTNTTMAATQASATGLVINSGAITTINTGYMAQSARRFLKMQRAPMQAKFRARLAKVNNSVMELGFGDASTFNGAITTGAYWQVTASGVVQPVVTFNSVDQTGSDVAGLLDVTKYYTFDVVLDDDEAIFYVQDTSTGLIISRQSIKLPLTGIRLWSSTALPLLQRLYNTGSAPASAPQMIVTDAYVLGLDANYNAPAAHAFAGLDRSAIAQPFTGAQSAQWSNSADPSSATLSNTAAGYATLGGRFQFAMVAGAATDYALFGYQVPAPANLFVTDIEIELWNTGAANAATPSRFEFAVSAGSTAVSLATATATRRGLGAIGIAASAVIGVMGDRTINRSWQTPLFVPSGRFFHVILRCPVPNAATASQVIQGMCNVSGYYA